MAIVVTEKGTGTTKGSGAYLWIDATFNTGDFIVGVAAGDTLGSSMGLYKSDRSTLVASQLSDVDVTNSGNVSLRVWCYGPLTSQEATDIGSIRFAIGTDDAAAGAVYQVTGLATTSTFDKSATATGSGTTAGAGPTATLSQADELGIGAIGMEEQTDEKGTWTTGAGYVSGNDQDAGTSGAGGASNISIFSVAEVLSVTTAQEAEQTSTGGNDWAAAVATYKGAEVPPPAAAAFGMMV